MRGQTNLDMHEGYAAAEEDVVAATVVVHSPKPRREGATHSTPV